MNLKQDRATIRAAHWRQEAQAEEPRHEKTKDVERFLLYLTAERGLAAKTIESYARDLRDFAGFQKKPLTAIERGDVRAFLAHQRTTCQVLGTGDHSAEDG